MPTSPTNSRIALHTIGVYIGSVAGFFANDHGAARAAQLSILLPKALVSTDAKMQLGDSPGLPRTRWGHAVSDALQLPPECLPPPHGFLASRAHHVDHVFPVSLLFY